MKLVVCTDGSKTANKAVEVAAKYANISGSELMVLTVVEDDVSREQIVHDKYGVKQREANSIIDGAREIIGQVASEISIINRVAVGPVSEEIIRIAEEEGAQSIFVGATGSNRIQRMLLGSVTDDIIHYSHCPVTVVR